MAVHLYQNCLYNKTTMNNDCMVTFAPVHFKSNQVNNALEKSPSVDSVVLSTKKSKKKTKNIFLKIGVAIAGIIIGTVAIKKSKENYIKKAKKLFKKCLCGMTLLKKIQ